MCQPGMCCGVEAAGNMRSQSPLLATRGVSPHSWLGPCFHPGVELIKIPAAERTVQTQPTWSQGRGYRIPSSGFCDIPCVPISRDKEQFCRQALQNWTYRGVATMIKAAEGACSLLSQTKCPSPPTSDFPPFEGATLATPLSIFMM